MLTYEYMTISSAICDMACTFGASQPTITVPFLYEGCCDMLGGAGRGGHVNCTVLDLSLSPTLWLVQVITCTLIDRPNK